MNPSLIHPPKYTVETIHRIYTKAGGYIEISPDDDFEGFLRIREVSRDGEILNTISAEEDHLRMVAELILKVTERV